MRSVYAALCAATLATSLLAGPARAQPAEPLSGDAGPADAGAPEDAGPPAPEDAGPPAPAPTLAPPPALAAPSPDAGEDVSLEDVMTVFQDQADAVVESATKTVQRAAEAPAVVTIVTAEEIQARGYTTIADVLRATPGFYDIYDGVTHNVGIRGINGGARASGDVLKLMIDGQPVDYRPSTGNFFGPELVPIEAVERVEIIRGPASALYGANAFLGVVNVITKSGEAARGVRLVGQGELVRGNPGGGGGLVLGGAGEGYEFLAAVSALYLDRSGLALPESSPVLTHKVDPAPLTPYAQRGTSQDDLERPVSVLLKGSSQLLGGRLSLLGSLQRLDAGGEFQDFGPLSHQTRIALLNQNYRAQYEAAPTEDARVQVAVQYFTGAPTDAERLGIARPDYVLVREAGVTGYGASAEGFLRLHKRFSLTLGADAVREDHLLQVFSELYPDGSRIPDGLLGQHQLFRNYGGFAQGVASITDSFSATAGVRVDAHNIYGVNPTGRLGLVYAPPGGPLSAKLLLGTSFKAPSAVELYTSPMARGDINGNPKLAAQTARTAELALGLLLPRGLGEISVDVFGSDVLGRVEFLQHGTYQQAFNLPDSKVVGGELDARLVLARPVQLRATASVAHTVAREDAALLSGLPEVTDPLYPAWQSRLFADFFLPWAALRASAEAAVIGPRQSSQPNAVLNGQAYTLDPYLDTALSLSTAKRHLLADTETSASLRVDDLLDRRWAEPGFGGIDVPSQGRTVRLTIVQSF